MLAFLFRETGHEVVAGLLPQSAISTVNLAETLTRFEQDGKDSRLVLSQLQLAPIEIVDFTVPQALLAARLAPLTRPLGLSLGDRACLALAQERGWTALTCDRAWSQLTMGISIRVIR